MTSLPPRRCFIGVGSPHGDDQVGWLIAEEVQFRVGTDCIVHQVGSPLEILDRIEGIEWLGIGDGVCEDSRVWERRVGEWHTWTWPDARIVRQAFSGSHDLGLAATLELAARLGRLPKTVVIWGIEIHSCQPGDPISESIRAAIPTVVEAILHCASLEIEEPGATIFPVQPLPKIA